MKTMATKSSKRLTKRVIGELAEYISTQSYLHVAFSVGVLKTISAAAYITIFADCLAQIHACCPCPSSRALQGCPEHQCNC